MMVLFKTRRSRGAVKATYNQPLTQISQTRKGITQVPIIELFRQAFKGSNSFLFLRFINFSFFKPLMDCNNAYLH